MSPLKINIDWEKLQSFAIAIIILVIIVYLILLLTGFNFGKTEYGQTKIDDCRKEIRLQSDDWRRYFGKYICGYQESKYDFYCVKIKKEGSFWGRSGCDTMYYYNPYN